MLSGVLNNNTTKKQKRCTYETLMALHSITLPLTYPLVFFVLLPSSSIPLVCLAVVEVVRDGGEYSGRRNLHRSARPQSTPKPADSQQKIKADKKKNQPSALFILLHPSIITTINNTGHSRTLFCFSFLRRDRAVPFPVTLPSLPTTPRLHQM